MVLTLGTTFALLAAPAHAKLRWGKPVRTLAAASHLELAVDGKGAVTVAGAKHGVVLVRRRTAAGHWLHAQGLLWTGTFFDSLDLAAERNGRELLAYTVRTIEDLSAPNLYRTVAAVRGRSGGFQQPFDLPTMLSVSVGLDDAGRAVIAGLTRDGALIAVRRAADGTLSEPQRLAEPGSDSFTDEGSATPVLAVGPGGRAVLAWVRLSRDRRTTTLEVAIAAPGEPFGPPQQLARYVRHLEDGNGGGDVGLRAPAIAVNVRGQAVLTYMVGGTTIGDHFRPESSDVMTAAAATDGPFGPPQLLSAGTGVRGAKITLDPMGGGVMTWYSVKPPCNSDGECSGSALYGASALSDGRFGAVRRLLKTAPYNDTVAGDRSGDSLVAYQRTNSFQARRCAGPEGVLRAPGKGFGRAARIAPGACLGFDLVSAGGGHRTFALAWNRAVSRPNPPVDVVVGRVS
jgi:hypothetical protein